MALSTVASSCSPGTAYFDTYGCLCYPYSVLYSEGAGTYYCGDGYGDYGTLCICTTTGTADSWQNVCDADYCMGQYCSDVTGCCSYCPPGTYSATGLSCISCSTCSPDATTIFPCDGYGSTSDVLCICNNGYTGNGITCSKSSSSSSSCPYGTCDTEYASCCLSDSTGPIAPLCFSGCYSCPAGSFST